MSSPPGFDDFLSFSSTITGFPQSQLVGTGQAEAYLETAREIAGDAAVNELLEAHRSALVAANGNEAERDRGIRRDIMSHDKLGPLARNLIKLWYVGTWYELGEDWRDKYGTSEKDATFVVSPNAYTEGLLWPAIGANPPGAKPHGYGMWATPPRIEPT